MAKIKKVGDKIICLLDNAKGVIEAKINTDYFSVSVGNEYRTVHKNQLAYRRISKDTGEFILGRGEFFSDKKIMKSLYLVIRMHMDSFFSGFEYMKNKTELITKIGDEHKQFKFIKIDYNGKFFRWNKDTFTTSADYIVQIGLDYIRVFEAKGVRDLLYTLMLNENMKISFDETKIGVYQSGGVTCNKDKTKFGCFTSSLDGMYYNIDIRKDTND